MKNEGENEAILSFRLGLIPGNFPKIFIPVGSRDFFRFPEIFHSCWFPGIFFRFPGIFREIFVPRNKNYPGNFSFPLVPENCFVFFPKYFGKFPFPGIMKILREIVSPIFSMILMRWGTKTRVIGRWNSNNARLCLTVEKWTFRVHSNYHRLEKS